VELRREFGQAVRLDDRGDGTVVVMGIVDGVVERHAVVEVEPTA